MIRSVSASVSGQHRLGDAGWFPRPWRPAQVEVGAQPSAGGFGPGAGLVDDEPQPPPDVTGPRAGDGDLEHAPVGGEAAEHLAGGQPDPVVVQAPQVGDRVPDRVPCRDGVG